MASGSETVHGGATHPGTKLKVMRSAAGFYLGYTDVGGMPYSPGNRLHERGCGACRAVRVPRS